MKRIGILGMLFLLNAFYVGAQVNENIFQTASLLRVVDTLEKRLGNLIGSATSLPPVYVDPALPSNARFVRDTIFLGPLQRDFHTFGDSLSLIYHEYLHKVFWQEQRFPFQFDANGQPVRIKTGTFYTYIPPSEQIDRDLENLRFYYERVDPDLTGAALEQRLAAMRKVLSQTQQLPFIYAPSNLTLEEIEAYTGQLEGEKKGLYTLSPTGRKSIQFRLYHLRQTYELRRAYEEENGLGVDGGKLNN